MQTNPTHFIEQVKYYDGDIVSFSPIKIHLLKWALQVSSKRYSICYTTAVFKIYPKIKPAIAHYDSKLKSVIIEA